MGAALALCFDNAGNSTTICATDFDAAIVETLKKKGAFHPALEHPLPGSVRIVGPEGWPQALSEATIVTFAVISAGVRPTARRISSQVPSAAVLVLASKGWDPETADPLSKVVEEECPAHPVVVLAGPTLAGELASGAPTRLVCASRDLKAADRLARAIGSSNVIVVTTDDVSGAEVGGALKNVLAIAVGICDGISEAGGRSLDNMKAAVFAQGLKEMGVLARALGGREETIFDLAGVGDLFVTVMRGRNGRFGRLVGAGVPPEQAADEVGGIIEGYENARQAFVLANRCKLDLPAVSMIHSVLYEAADPEEAVRQLVLGTR
jgi:glycerol-3-phosphate dehydrogenase (NAD(P)+)